MANNKTLQNGQETALPPSFFRILMDDQLGRGYLNRIRPSDWNPEDGISDERIPDYKWLHISCLADSEGRNADVISENWRSVLSTCHAIGMRVAFVLLRTAGKTELYLGAASSCGSYDARNQLHNNISSHMPEMELKTVHDEECKNRLMGPLGNMNYGGIITGIPSLRGEPGNATQTLDKLAQGIYTNGKEQSYALLIFADPANDGEVLSLQQKFLDLKSEIHQLSAYTSTYSHTDGKNQQKSFSGGVPIGNILAPVMSGLAAAATLTGHPLLGAGVEAAKKAVGGFFVSAAESGGSNSSDTQGVNREYINAVAQYCEGLIDRNVARLDRGRNLGFWQTGIYVLSNDDLVTNSVMGILRSVYSGEETYVEPIRIINTGSNQMVLNNANWGIFTALPRNEKTDNHWHILGRMYESLTTALTTQELAIATGLPRRENAGLPVAKKAVAFSNNAAPRKNGISLGTLVNMGRPGKMQYQLPYDALVRHSLIVGKPGGGKSTTCKKIIQGVRSKNIPVMIIEPIKDDYVRWAVEQNKRLPENKQFTIIMPGALQIEGIKPTPLWLNLFQPMRWKEKEVDLIQHAESVITLLNASLPGEDVIPLIIEEAFYACLEEWAKDNGINLDDKYSLKNVKNYPSIDALRKAGNEICNKKTYEEHIKENFREILKVRFDYLERGTRGRILNTSRSNIDEDTMERSIVINLSKLTAPKDKALIMSLLLLYVQEYRTLRYENDPNYREEAQQNKLIHMLVLEEAHTVLSKSAGLHIGNDPKGAAAEYFENMLREIRSYGQGIMIVDQTPSKLIDSAIQNTGYKIVHNLPGAVDIDTMAAAMRLNPRQADLLAALEVGHAVIYGDEDAAATWVEIENK